MEGIDQTSSPESNARLGIAKGWINGLHLYDGPTPAWREMHAVVHDG